MARATHLLTAEEFARLLDHEHWCELVAGRVVRMSPPGFRHGQVAVAFASLLNQHVKAHGLGVVLVESGYKLTSNPDTVRGPDVSFVDRARLPSGEVPAGFWAGPPDLAVEVLSPDDRPGETRAKTDEYLAAGARLVLVIDPEAKSVTIARRLAAPLALHLDDALDLDDVVPGFRCAIRQIFE